MSDSDLILPQEIYWQYLETINGIKFTSREMEVISCLINTLGTTKIVASLLSMAPKTVGTHTSSIMSKIDCSSRQGIIDFIEKSGQFSLIKKHYRALKIRNYFEQQLKRIRLPVGNTLCEIIEWIGQENLLINKLQKSLKNQLKEHLEFASITVNLTTKNSGGFIYYSERSTHLTFHILSQTLEGQLSCKLVRPEVR